MAAILYGGHTKIPSPRVADAVCSQSFRENLEANYVLGILQLRRFAGVSLDVQVRLRSTRPDRRATLNPPKRVAAEECVLRCSRKSCCAAFLSVACFFSLGLDPPAAAAPLAARSKKSRPDPVLKGLPPMDLSADEAILHALNRLSYGPRPGDIQRVKQIGLAKWIELQLNGNSIDDKRLEPRLENLPTLRLSTAQLIDQYPPAKAAAQQALTQSPTRSPSAAAVPPAPAMTADAPANPAGKPENSNGTSSMKQIPQVDGNAANCVSPSRSSPNLQHCRRISPTTASGRSGSSKISPWPRLRARFTASGNSSRLWMIFGSTTSMCMQAKATTSGISLPTNAM